MVCGGNEPATMQAVSKGKSPWYGLYRGSMSNVVWASEQWRDILLCACPGLPGLETKE